MSIIGWITGNNVDREYNIIVKTAKSKGPTAESVTLTVGDIKNGKVTDSKGYTSEVVLFLRKGKK